MKHTPKGWKWNDIQQIATPEHPFYVANQDWTGAIELRAGDILVLQNGEYVVVERIQHELLEESVIVYNFEVADFHTYYVGQDSVLVHNMCAQPIDKKTISNLAKSSGYKSTNYFSKGQRIFYNSKTKTYITYDVDGHNGGFWKMAKSIKGLSSKSTRLGTYDQFFNWIGK